MGVSDTIQSVIEVALDVIQNVIPGLIALAFTRIVKIAAIEKNLDILNTAREWFFAFYFVFTFVSLTLKILIGQTTTGRTNIYVKYVASILNIIALVYSYREIFSKL